MKPYPKYKDSGIDWLGEVPEGWEALKLKYGSDVIMGQSPSSDDYSDDSLKLPFLQGNADFSTRYPIPRVYCDSANKKIPKGSILVSVRAPVGALNEADQDYGIGRGLCALVPKSNLHKDYAWYQLHVTRLELTSLATGSTYDAVSVDEVADMIILVPQIEEQQAIATFLDRETARIDALIQQKERMIELLKEKRIALITQAVTKGLNPNAPMKDSGIEWLGEVPEHWDVKRLKYVSSCNDESLPETTDPDFEMLYVDISSVSRILGITTREEMSFEDAPSRARRKVKNGDTIVSTVRTYLRAIAPIENAEDNLIVSTGFAVLRPVSIYSDYLSLVIQSHFVVESIVARSVGVSYPAINATEIGDICITNPPMSEQRSIVDNVRKATLQIDALQSKNEHSITLLREYRSSLINRAVTGKIDLRDYNAQAQ